MRRWQAHYITNIAVMDAKMGSRSVFIFGVLVYVHAYVR